MYILIVDDDYLQAEWVIDRLKKSFSNSKITWMETEYEFRANLDELTTNPPDVIIMDVMLSWTRPGPDMPEWPADVRDEGFYTAGFRCEKLLSDNKKLKNIPLIFYTVLERADLIERQYKFVEGSRVYLQKPHRAYLRKESEAEPLIDLIRRLAKQH
jgi:CheY-like chemotaxis protein